MSRAAQGLRAWLLQRFTAIYLGAYLLFLLAFILMRDTSMDFSAWRTLMASPLVGVATALFALALLLHAWVGVRDVLIDYIQAVWLRLLLMVVTALMLLGSLLWVIRALTLVAVQGGH